jgi:hypothetical protein
MSLYLCSLPLHIDSETCRLKNFPISRASRLLEGLECSFYRRFHAVVSINADQVQKYSAFSALNLRSNRWSLHDDRTVIFCLADHVFLISCARTLTQRCFTGPLLLVPCNFHFEYLLPPKSSNNVVYLPSAHRSLFWQLLRFTQSGGLRP